MSNNNLIRFTLEINNNYVRIIAVADDFYLNVKDKVVIFRSEPDVYQKVIHFDGHRIENIAEDYIKEHYPNVQLTNIKKLSYRYATPEEVERINSIEQAAIKNGTVYD